MRGEDPGQPLTTAVAQFTAGNDVDANGAAIARLAETAAAEGARLVVFPEASMTAWDASAADLADAADTHSERFLDVVRQAARATGAMLVVGMFAPAPTGRPYNRMVAVAPDGEILGSYDKVHLYDAFSWRESDKVTPSPTSPDFRELVTVPCGDFTLGLLNCYDLRFPEMARVLVQRGADVLVVSSAWVSGPYKEMHWETLLRARAVENTAYVVAANQSPPASVGLSMIVDPFGLIAATCVHSPGITLHPLQRSRLAEVRATLPSLAHRRYRIAPAAHSSDRADTEAERDAATTR